MSLFQQRCGLDKQKKPARSPRILAGFRCLIIRLWLNYFASASAEAQQELVLQQDAEQAQSPPVSQAQPASSQTQVSQVQTLQQRHGEADFSVCDTLIADTANGEASNIDSNENAGNEIAFMRILQMAFRNQIEQTKTQNLF